MSTYLRLTWAQRRLLIPTAVILILGAWVLASMTLIALSLNGEGDLTTLGVIGVVGVASTVIVAEAAARQSAIERWPLLRRLRIVGLGNRTLLVTMTVESVVVGATAAVLGYALSLTTLPLLVPYLQRVGVIGTKAALHSSGIGPGMVLATMVATSVIGSLRSVARVTRTEPVAPALHTRSESPVRTWTRRIIATAFLIGTLWATAWTIAHPAGDKILLTSTSWLGLLSVLWRPATAFVAKALLRQPQRRADTLLSRRWTASASTATASIGAILAVGITVVVTSLYSVPDAAAREGLSRWLNGRDIAVSSNAGAPTPPGSAILAQVTTRIHRPSQPAPLRSRTAYQLTSQSAEVLFSDILLEGHLGHASEGVIVPGLVADQQHLHVGDTLAITGPEANTSSRTMPVIAVVAIPATFGNLIVSPTPTDLAPATGPRLAVGAGLKPTAGWEVFTAEDWIDSLAPGKALSNSGGDGTLEIPLLIGAPLLLCLALIGSAIFITVHARGEDLITLGKIGTPRVVLRRVVAFATTANILPAALCSATILWMLTHYALIPDSRLLGAGSPPTGPISLYAVVVAGSLAVALVTSQASIGRHLR